ncbi:MAG: GNAT family acetyltransferase [Lachnospiraceae bacterium]|nr:GNAT family acetyltransferase [Lachnospiraceae bacterium]
MIDAKDILSMNFYTYEQPFTGSCDGMRYRIVMIKEEIGRDENDKPIYGEKFFEVLIWPEPYNYENTDSDLIVKKIFPFTEEGYMAIVDYLNSNLEKYAGSTRIYNIRKDEK